MHWGCTLVAHWDTSLIVHIQNKLRCTEVASRVVVSEYFICGCIVALNSVYILDLQLNSINVVETCLDELSFPEDAL